MSRRKLAQCTRRRAGAGDRDHNNGNLPFSDGPALGGSRVYGTKFSTKRQQEREWEHEITASASERKNYAKYGISSGFVVLTALAVLQLSLLLQVTSFNSSCLHRKISQLNSQSYCNMHVMQRSSLNSLKLPCMVSCSLTIARNDSICSWPRPDASGFCGLFFSSCMQGVAKLVSSCQTHSVCQSSRANFEEPLAVET